MKHIWSCRRTFLATLTIIGLLYLMSKGPGVNYALECAGLAGGVGFINAWQKKGKDDGKTEGS